MIARGISTREGVIVADTDATDADIAMWNRGMTSASADTFTLHFPPETMVAELKKDRRPKEYWKSPKGYPGQTRS